MKILVIVLLCIYGQTVFAQKDTVITNHKLNKDIENYLTDREYTRIPNKDFDRILQNSVDEEVKDRLMFWLTIIGIAIAGFGGVSVVAFNFKIKEVVEKEVNKKKEELLKEVKEMGLESRMNRLAVDVGSLIEKINTNAKSTTVKSEAYRLLDEAKTVNNKSLIPEIIDALVGVLFKEKNVQEIDELISSYEKDYKLNARTYASAGIINMDVYELDGINKYKENSIKYSNAAIDENIYYGDPRGTLILVHAIDFLKAEDQAEKEKAKMEVKQILTEILKATSGYIASNTVKRLEKDEKVADFKKYLEAMKDALPEEFKKLYTKATSYDQRTVVSQN